MPWEHEIMRKDIPWWYELSWDDLNAAIILRVHRDLLAGLRDTGLVPMTEEQPIVADFIRQHRGLEFDGSFEGAFGFGSCMQLAGAGEESVNFAIKLPTVESLGDTCDRCGGTGLEDGIRCLRCGGRRRKIIYDWSLANAIATSLHMFFTVSSLHIGNGGETSAGFPQLLTLQVADSSHGNSLGGFYSRALIQWLATLGREFQLPGIADAMRLAHDRMFLPSAGPDFGERALAERESGRFYMRCSGGASASYVYGSICGDSGCEFSCHSVDNRVQQLTLLAGLAALHDQARREMQRE